MPSTPQDDPRSSDIRDQVKKGLSEVRTTVLGGQILLGFQYEALFQSRFGSLSPQRQSLELAAFGLLLLAMVLMIAPAAFHQISERGRSTGRQRRFTRVMVGASLAPFGLAMGVNVAVVLGGELGPAGAMALGVIAVIFAAFLWYGIEIMAAKPLGSPRSDEPSGAVALRERVSDLMTETRIVLPGVQALLGFQFAAYLTDAFARLPADARAAHDLSLVLLLASMVLLMTPAPFHRLAEDGRETERLCRLTVTMIVLALGALALGLAADIYVAAMVVTKNGAAAAAFAAAAAVFALSVWFVYPLVCRARRGSPLSTGPLQRRSRHA